MWVAAAAAAFEQKESVIMLSSVIIVRQCEFPSHSHFLIECVCFSHSIANTYCAWVEWASGWRVFG